MRDAGRAAVIARVASIHVDWRESKRDRLTHIDAPARDLDVAPDRSFTLETVAPPHMPEGQYGWDFRVVEYELTVFYAPNQNIEARINCDAERIEAWLLGLQWDEPAIDYCIATRTGVLEGAKQIRVTYSVEVGYRVSDAIAANTAA